MANKQITLKQLLLRNDTAANWSSKNPVLGKGEIGIESDTRKFKFGDGVTAWNTLIYAVLEVAESAKKLSTPRKIKIAGAATGEASFDGSADASISIVLADSGATAGTYTVLTVNSKGLVTSARALTATDIPNLSLSKITDAGTAASKNIGTASGNIPILNASGQLDDAVIPPLAISDIHEVDNQAAMLALVAQRGDIAVRSDENKTYILKASPASTISNWVLLKTPTDLVLSVNGKTGAITLTTDNIAEGSSNKYYTDARFDTRFASKTSTDLSDGEKIISTEDTITINCGGA